VTANVDVVGSCEIVRIRRTQKAEAVRQNFDDAFADDVDFFRGVLLEDRKHQLLFAHRARVFDLKFLRHRNQLDGGFLFEFGKFDFPHWG